MSVQQQQQSATCQCKVAETAWAYRLSGLPQELGEYWGTDKDDHDRQSITDITAYLNRMTIEAACEQAGMDLIDGEAENFRRLLMDDDVDSGTQEEARGKLTRHGVNVDVLEDNLVAPATVYRHLTKCLGLEHQREALTPDSGIRRVSDSRDHLKSVVRGTLDRLGHGPAVDSVTVGVKVTCAHCGRVHDAFRLIEEAGCDCQQSQ